MITDLSTVITIQRRPEIKKIVPNDCDDECFVCLKRFHPEDDFRVVDEDDEDDDLGIGSICPTCYALTPALQEHILQARANSLNWAYCDVGHCDYLMRQIIQEQEWEDHDWLVYELRRFSEFFHSQAIGIGVESDTLRSYCVVSSAPRCTTGHVYLLGSPDGYCKIGRAQNVHARLAQVGLQLPFKVELIHSVAVYDAVKGERALHRRFKDQRMNGEWFNLSAEDIGWVRRLTARDIDSLD